MRRVSLEIPDNSRIKRDGRRISGFRNETGDTDVMEKFLNDYIERMRPTYNRISQKTAHDVAATYLSYKFGLYGKAAEEASRALGALPDGDNMTRLKKALVMIGERSKKLDNSDYSLDTSVSFTPDDLPFLAMNLGEDQVEDMSILFFDNAILLIYAAAYVSSSEDQDTLDEQSALAINILETYQNSLIEHSE